jgi:hypothetical protein
MPEVARDKLWVLTWRVTLVAIIIGLIGLAVSCLNTDNPQGSEDVYMGYPLFAFIGSRSLLISFPPIPRNVSVLWTGLVVDLLVYTIPGFVASFLVFNLRENMRLLKFLVKSGAVFLFGSFLVLAVLSIFAGASPYQVVPPIFIAGELAFLFALAAAPITTILYGYYLLTKKRRNQPKRESQ